MIRFLVALVCGLIAFAVTQYIQGPPVPSVFAIVIGVIVFAVVLAGKAMFDDDLDLGDIGDLGGGDFGGGD